MNFVLFMPDQQRADVLGCYSHPVAETPNWNRLAAAGTRFDQCHVQQPLCTPSRCCLMTGWYPHVRGHRTIPHLLGRDDPSLFRTLKEAGYRIEIYGKNDVFNPAHAACAAHVAEHRWGGAAERIYEPGDPEYYTFLQGATPGGETGSSDWPSLQAGLDFLHSPRAQEGPFVLFLPLVMPHPTYSAPEPYHSMYAPEKMALLPPDEGRRPSFHRLIREYRGLDRLEAAVLQQIRAVYLGMTSYVDWMLGQVLEALDGSGLANTTTLIATSDHGDFAGDYGLVEKWSSSFCDAMTRVPLLIRTPGGTAGHVVQEPVEMFDIMATVLELAGLTAQHTHFSQSLCDQLHGAAGDPDRAVFGCGGYNAQETHCLTGTTLDDPLRDPAHVYSPQTRLRLEHPESYARAAAIRTQGWKLVHRPSEVSELYDLVHDPGEQHNLWDAPAARAPQTALLGRLLDRLIQTSDVVPFTGDERQWDPALAREGAG